MKKTRKMLSVAAACLMMATSLSGCGGGGGSTDTTAAPQSEAGKTEESKAEAEAETPAAEAKDASDVGVVLIVNGTIGDKAFNDLAYAGLQQAQEEFGINGLLVENNYDTTKYEPSIIEFAEDPDYDLIIVNSADVKEIVEKVAPDYPDKKFVIYDSSIDYSVADLSNVYSVTFKQNEATFLAGALSAKMTTLADDGMVNDQNIIGYVAGGENVIINDFLLGYIEGCEYADPETRMLISYIGNFSDAAKGKEMGLSQVSQGADVIFQVADQAGLGVLEACKDSGVYAIGVDCDQYELFAETDKEQADVIMTSVLKRVDTCVYSSIKRYIEGTLPFGEETEAGGIKEGMVAIAKNANYERIVPQDIRDYIDDLEKKVASGEITVTTNIGAEISVIEDAKDRIKP
ncbi:BMP family ABC transporter substrate-binding protein [Lachnospiraceae bacterium 62-35]